jgi:acetolactate decarboxylase
LALLQCEIPQSIQEALEKRRVATGESVSHIVTRALADALQLEHATLFQVSTSGALVEGVYQGAVSVGDLLQHGDFGLGTFEDLDGEMILVDGRCYRARDDGTVTTPPETALVPFAVVTYFHPERTVELLPVSSFEALIEQLDALRSSENLFFAVSAEGTFDFVRVRTVCKAERGERLVEAASKQKEFEFRDVAGQLLGFWTPEYARTVNIPGYHLHFLTADRRGGGHLLDCRASVLSLGIEHAADFRMAIPETREFLRADLTGDPSEDLAKAERQR